MIPPSTKDLINIGQSKYAVVVAAAQRARSLSEKRRNDENYRLSSMVTEALEDIIHSRVIIINKEESLLGKEV
ncbi:MAG: DNA-directed RNA polymerase subunit omega [Firmicutes bacterium HGW-Firmicutes-15]|nr:MAG: DNA-directed RNA polymerase subunit omega [Firmicutes bacterium HGW-Firmicutes-15]